MKKTTLAISTFMIGILSVSAFVYTPNGEASGNYLDISKYLEPHDGSEYGSNIEDYSEFAYAYMELASDYADEACKESDAAEDARDDGDYEAFQEHLEASEKATAYSQFAADASTAYAEALREIVDAAAEGKTSTSSGVSIEYSN
jgi:hypothetical protein